MPKTIAFLLPALLSTSALAEPAPEASTPHATVRLVSEVSAAAPGTAFQLAFEQHLIPGWHTYWENPGDSGEPVQLTWRLPDGVNAGAIQWPTPDAIPVGPLVNFGFSERAVFLSEISLPPAWPAGEPLSVVVDAYWLVCEKECIPEWATLAIEIPTASEPVIDPAAAATIAFGRTSQPAPFSGRAEYALGDSALLLTVALADLGVDDVASARFFPAAWGQIDHPAPQELAMLEELVTLRAPLGQAPPAGPVRGILRATDASGREWAWSLTATPGGTAPGAAAPEQASGAWLWAILAALLGGVILNLMPCVFPVLALKAFGLMQHADAPARQRLAGGIAYTTGVLASFLALGGALIVARAGGIAVGWGFQLQHPTVVALLALVMFAVGLSLSGVLTVGHSLTRIDHRAASRSDWVGSFMTGVLAAVVAAPCTAPFMAAAVGVAVAQPPLPALAIFGALGLGLALPYLLLAAWPALAARLPRPGAWMEQLRQLLAFPMYAAAVWLIWVLAQQVGPDRVGLVLLGAVLLALGAWLWNLGPRRFPRALGVLTALFAVGIVTLGPAREPVTAPQAAASAWESYTPERLATLTGAGRPVFLNLTAAWCITCKVNERVALDTDTFREALDRHDAVYLRGDWTSRDDVITSLLESFGRAGVPLYVVYDRQGQATVLPQVLTPSIVAEAIAQAAAPVNQST